jgi:acetoin utilization deacetylase AcuC-like enzyme
VRIFYTDHFELPLPEGHRFPMSKYRRLRSRIAGDAGHRDDVFLVPPAATDDQLLTCHSLRYLTAVKEGTLSAAEIRRIGFPWSEKMVERSRRSSGATLAAARAAIGGEHVAVNLAGGTHHAMSDAGEGYCVFNDAAVTIRTLQTEALVRRACVIDLDVHQGNGTAQITAGDESIFTLSIHGEKNFPSRKYPSSLDIDLPDGTQDDEYLVRLVDALDQVSRQGPFDLAVYLAGADPYVGDRLGRLGLSKFGLACRDETVLDWAAKNRLPVAIAMAGGYAPDVEDIVDIHAATVGLASKFWQRLKNK